MGIGFGAFDFIFTCIFLFIIGMFIVTAIKGIETWNRNNNSPRLSVIATVTGKRIDVSQNQQPNAGDVTGAHGYMVTTDTTYFLTFQVESGDRMEFRVSGTEYGMVAEGDVGKLTFQGTRYLSFER